MGLYNGFIPNYPEYKHRIESIASKLTELANSDKSHLADIGCAIGFYKTQLEELQADIFKSHQQEKSSLFNLTSK